MIGQIRNHNERYWLSLLKVGLSPLALLLYWQLTVWSGMVSTYLLPAPASVLETAVSMWQSGELISHIQTSLSRVLLGFAGSIFIGVSVAVMVNLSRSLELLLSAPLALLRMIPPLAMVPLLILWLGIGSATQISIIILASVFPIFLNTRDGLRRLSAEHRELARSLQLDRQRYYLLLVLPAALPSMITGIRLGFGYAWRALVGAEMIAAASGLGYLVLDAQELMRTDKVMVGILAIGLIGWSLDQMYYFLVCRGLSRRFPEIRRQ